MKERIVIGRNEDTSEIVKKFPNRSGEHIDFIEIFTPHENCKFEQVPETWEELLELCKKLNNKKIEIIFVNIRIIVHLEDNCEISFTEPMSDMWFKKNDIEARIRTDLKPEQMWQIIKNLIGEE